MNPQELRDEIGRIMKSSSHLLNKLDTDEEGDVLYPVLQEAIEARKKDAERGQVILPTLHMDTLSAVEEKVRVATNLLLQLHVLGGLYVLKANLEFRREANQ